MRKPLTAYMSASRSPLVSHMQAAAMGYATLGQYTNSQGLTWMRDVARYYFSRKHAQPAGTVPKTIPSVATIAIAGDWASGTEEAARIGNHIASHHPDITIHLGDTYYVGTEQEQKENFLGISIGSTMEPVAFPRGALGTFALPGNHDMYSNGAGFYDTVLKTLGQPSSCFCLENQSWRIIGLDTAYNSTGIELGPIHPSCAITSQHMDWLRGLNLDGDSRRLVFLSHHGPWSAFETSYPGPYRQLATLTKRNALWFWGHEHRMAIYAPNALGGFSVLGRCIGHGGMPVATSAARKSPVVTFTDARLYPNAANLKIGYNGYAIVNLSGAGLSVEYRDVEDAVVRREIQSAGA